MIFITIEANQTRLQYETPNPPTIPLNAHIPKEDDMTTLLPLICIAIVIIAPIIIFQATKPKFKR